MAGAMLERLFRRLGWNRPEHRFTNVIQCAPPVMQFASLHWAQQAIAHCRQHLQPILDEPHQVVVPLGATAIKSILGLGKIRGATVENFHGTVCRDPENKFWVVPSYHPSFLQRGATNLIQTVCWDLLRAKEVADHGWEPDPASIVVDPPVDWFRALVRAYKEASRHDPWAVPLAVDLETLDTKKKDKDDLTREDQSYTITRVNFSCNPDEGLSVPFEGDFIPLIAEALEGAGILYTWFGWDYDWPRLMKAGNDLNLPGLRIALSRVVDLMWAAHMLQSDVPTGLGFWAPFYSRFGPWKHLAESSPGFYAAVDGLQTRRVGDGIVGDLVSQGMWDGPYDRHVAQLYEFALQPAHVIGVGIDRPALEEFRQELIVKSREAAGRIQAAVPDDLKPLTPKEGYKLRPVEGKVHAKAKDEDLDEVKRELYGTAHIVERQIQATVLECASCGVSGVQRRHRCADRSLSPRVGLVDRVVTRWFWQEPFNPDSWQQLLRYIKAKSHKPGRAKDGKETTDKETLKRLWRETSDPLYSGVLDSRAVNKVRGTYVDGTLRRLDPNDRVHSVATFRPSMFRLSYVDPNITNVVADKGGKEGLAAGFRKAVVAADVPRLIKLSEAKIIDLPPVPSFSEAASILSCRLHEIDFKSIEAVIVGWCARDPYYIRLAKLGVHAGLASHVVGKPYDPSWLLDRPADLAKYFEDIKEDEPVIYDQAKRTVHGDNYGLTEWGMVENFPDIFPDLATARKFKAIYRKMAPEIPKWQSRVRDLAYRQGFLGSPGDPRLNWEKGYHPFGYKHWFWSVIRYQPITETQRIRAERRGEGHLCIEIQSKWYKVKLGEDAKRAIAFFPQSIARGILTEAMLRLFHPESESFIGDAFYGKTPLRAPIHDSLLLEVPVRTESTVLDRVYREMLRPIPEIPLPVEWELGQYLSIGISAKAGVRWSDMEKVKIPDYEDLGVAGDSVFWPAEEAEEDDVDDLRRSVA